GFSFSMSLTIECEKTGCRAVHTRLTIYCLLKNLNINSNLITPLTQNQLTASSDSDLSSLLHGAIPWNEAKNDSSYRKTVIEICSCGRRSVAHFMGFGTLGAVTPGLHPGLYAAAHFMGLKQNFIF